MHHNCCISQLCGVIVIFLLLPVLSFASDSLLSGYLESGKRSQAEDFEEEDNDSEYSYQNYHLKLKQELSDRLNYSLSSFVYDKNYKSGDSLDNISKIFTVSGSYYSDKKKTDSLRLNVGLKYKEKRFRNTPSGEYNQIMFSPGVVYTKKDSYALALSAGINNFDYLNASSRDQLNLFVKPEAKKYLFDKKLLIKSSFKLETTTKEKAGRRKDKNAFVFGADYIMDYRIIYKLSTKAETGESDTKDDDGRDEDLDYKYTLFYAKTESSSTLKLHNSLEYQYFKKDYQTADLDHSGYYILSSWRYKILDNKTEELYCDLTIKYKDVAYSLMPGSDYKSKILGISGTYDKKKLWQTSLMLQWNIYDYEDFGRDKNRYYARLSFEKPFPANDLTLSVDLKYKYTDYRHNSSTEEESVRLAFKYEF